MHTFSGFVSPDEIIADVTTMVDDEGFKEFSEGSYMSEMQQALSELAFDTMFDERVDTIPVPGSLIAKAPDGMISLEAVYLFNGNKCDASGGQKVWHAVNYYRHGNAMFKDQRGQNNDIILDNVFTGASGRVYFYGRRNDELHLSDSCGGWENLLVKYRGMGCKIGDQPIVPHELRQAVKNRMAMTFMRTLVTRGKRNRADLAELKVEHYGGNGPMHVGTWQEAKRRMNKVDIGTRNDVSQYLHNLSLKITR